MTGERGVAGLKIQVRHAGNTQHTCTISIIWYHGNRMFSDTEIIKLSPVQRHSVHKVIISGVQKSGYKNSQSSKNIWIWDGGWLSKRSTWNKKIEKNMLSVKRNGTLSIYTAIIILATPPVEDIDTCQCIIAIYWSFHF